MNRSPRWIPALLAIAALGCGGAVNAGAGREGAGGSGGSGGAGGEECRPGETLACRCDDGASGTRVCGEECVCTFALTAEPAAIDFGEVPRGERREATLAIRNPAPRAVALRSIGFADGPGATFELPGALPASIPAEGSVEVRVGFVAATPGPAVARLRVEPADDAFAAVEVTVSGRAPGPVLACTPGEVAFPSGWTGETRTATVVCANVGYAGAGDDARLALDRLEVAGAGFSAAWREAPPAGGLAVGASAAIEVTFAGAEAGDYRATLTVGGQGATAQVRLSATALEVPPCDVEIRPSEIRFGIIDKGSAVDLEFTILNRRPDAPCLVRSVQLCEGTDPAWALLGGPYGPLVIPAGVQAQFPIQFAPDENSCREGTEGCLEIDLAPDQRQTVSLVCGGGGPPTEPLLLLAPNDLDFGAVPVGEERERQVQLISTTSSPQFFERVEFAAGASDEFAIVSAPPAGTAIPPGLSASVLLAYRPVDEGVDETMAYFYVRDAVEPYAIPVSGQGWVP
jgi:hypothetical protein